MNDDIIIFHEACNSLTEDKAERTKLLNDYPYHCKVKGLFYSDGFDSKGKKAKTVNASEFYPWVRARRIKKYPKISYDNIPKQYKTAITKASFQFKNRLEGTEHEEQIWALTEKIKQLEMELEDERVLANKWRNWRATKGKKAIRKK